MITNKVTSILQNKMLDEKIQQLFYMAISHECQHQELLVYDLQHLLADRYRPLTKNPLPTPSLQESTPIKIIGGLYIMGYSGINFAMVLNYLNTKCILMTTKLTRTQLQTNNT